MREGDRIILIILPVALYAGEPHVMTDGCGGLRRCVLEGAGEARVRAALESLLVRQARFPPARAEQLPVHVRPSEDGVRTVEIPHLITTQMTPSEPGWVPWYDTVPWEDRRTEDGCRERDVLAERLCAEAGTDEALSSARLLTRRRLNVLFGLDGCVWRPELAAERSVALGRAGLLRDKGERDVLGADGCQWLASAISHLRRGLHGWTMPPELMPERFTIPQFQAAAEGVLGEVLDKQVFRRNILNTGCLENTGAHSDEVAGRPAKLFRFRNEMVVAQALRRLSLTFPLHDGLLRQEGALRGGDGE